MNGPEEDERGAVGYRTHDGPQGELAWSRRRGATQPTPPRMRKARRAGGAMQGRAGRGGRFSAVIGLDSRREEADIIYLETTMIRLKAQSGRLELSRLTLR